jgi:hypothetical protein
MFLLELLDGLYSLYLILFAGPRAVVRWIRRLSKPTASELAVSMKPEMQRFRRNAWLFGIGWLVLSFVLGIASGSLWYGLIVFLIGLMIIPGQIERRYDKLVAELSPAT